MDQLRDAVGPIGEHAHRRLERDGRGARTVTVKLKKSDMSTLTRSATLPYATTDVSTLLGTARRLLLDPVEIGPIRLVGVGFSGLSEVMQESLFPDLDQMLEASDSHQSGPVPASQPESAGWRIGDDITHTEFGHGWVQGAGHGVMSVRFETRASGPGMMRTFADDSPEVERSDPLDSLDWPEYVASRAERSTPGAEDVGDG